MKKHPLSLFANDTIKLIKKDGSEIENIKAQVQPKVILVYDISICFDEGDIITRELPNKKVEYYRIVNPIYDNGFKSIPPFYKLEVEKTTALPKTKTPSVKIINNINASEGSKVLVAAVDNSVNITSQDLSVFDELIEAVKKIQNSNEMIAKIEQMKASVHDKESYRQKYCDLIQIAAAHMTIIAPFIPALTKFLS